MVKRMVINCKIFVSKMGYDSLIVVKNTPFATIKGGIIPLIFTD